MRISELSTRSGVPVATIKYYLREKLLPEGQRSSPTQAAYTETHVQRLGVIRALVDAGVGIAGVRKVVGVSTGSPNFSASAWTGEGRRAMPRPAGAGARV